MLSVGDELDQMVISTTSPDGGVHARISNYHDLEVRFNPWALGRYDEPTLAHQLSRLGALTWVAYHRGRSDAYKRSLGLSTEELAAAERPSDDLRRREYEEALSNIEGNGVSALRMIRVQTIGLLRWDVDITPGAIQQLGEERLISEIQSAFASLLRDRQMKIVVLKSDYFDMGIPRKWLDQMAELRAINN